MNTSVAEKLGTVPLYERLGAAAGIERLVDASIDGHMRNPAIKARFLPYRDAPDRLAELKQHLCRFMAVGTGGPDEYDGRSMPEAHRGMNVSEAEYMAATDDILNAMDGHGYDRALRNEVLAILYSLKEEIMRV
ncbi:MAG: group 1 truncated hemoglobin [Roseovarius sp.]|nr:group 1 truncated hemoglobin [Roseovarius sp.]